EISGGTKLSLLHEGISAAAGEAAMGLLMALDAGWDKHLASLRSAVA
ncbi:MAG: SRPBCC domain-containing protein, partial [Rhodobacteraceae bacterium]|nr:SRPBCC domain-containing protein [Paracoccaceae bacterium]